MKNLYPIFLCLFFLTSCGNFQKSNNTSNLNIQEVKENTPNSCNIEGTIVSILPITEKNSIELCAQHSCKAVVKILKKSYCGVDINLEIEQVITINFAFSLDPTKKIKEVNNKDLPGLKPGDHFNANVSSRLTMGNNKTYTVYNYTKL